MQHFHAGKARDCGADASQSQSELEFKLITQYGRVVSLTLGQLQLRPCSVDSWQTDLGRTGTVFTAGPCRRAQVTRDDAHSRVTGAGHRDTHVHHERV